MTRGSHVMRSSHMIGALSYDRTLSCDRVMDRDIGCVLTSHLSVQHRVLWTARYEDATTHGCPSRTIRSVGVEILLGYNRY